MNIKIATRNKLFCLFRRLYISGLYENRVGIKSYNQLVSSELFASKTHSQKLQISIDELCLPFDGLNDQFTLLGTTLKGSPHYGLVQSIRNGDDIRSCEYVCRRRRGTLDFLPSMSMNSKHLYNLKRSYVDKVTLVEEKKYNPIKVAFVSGKYYILDGKHTAATCYLLGVTPTCIDVSSAVLDSFFWWVCRKMEKSKRNYNTHLEWFQNIEFSYQLL
jgi:hypothetical protein